MAKRIRSAAQGQVPCLGKTKNGRCKARPMGDGRYCFFHDPEREEERQRARRRGAAVTNGLGSTPLALKAPDGLRTIRELMELVEVVLRGCIENDVDHKLATTMGGLIRVQASLLVDYELENRVETLEAALKEEAHATS